MAGEDERSPQSTLPDRELVGSAPTEPSPPDLTAATLGAGRVLSGRYRVLGLLGQGGMGQVYRAQDLELDREIALKTLRIATVEAQALLRREVRLASRISHPNVIRLHDLASAEQTLFLTMELVAGQSLRARLTGGPLGVAEACELARQCALGLGAAHAAGVVHRDFKPENVLLETGGRVVVADFGVAGEDSQRSTASAVVGTSAYMAPEQADGRRPTAQSDLYALGLVLFEMLVGEVPLLGGGVLATALRRITEPPPALRERRPDAPPALAALLGRLLAQEPADRPASADAVAGELATWAKPLGAAREGTPRIAPASVRRPRRRARWRVGLALGAAAAAAAGFALRPWTWSRRPAGSAPPALVMRRITAAPPEKPMDDFHALSPDGATLAFTDSEGLHLLDLASAGQRDLALPKGHKVVAIAWYPDGQQLLASFSAAGATTEVHSIRVSDGVDTRIVEGSNAIVSHDGRTLAFARKDGVWLAESSGASPRRLLEASPIDGVLAFSPTDDRLLIQRGDAAGTSDDLLVLSVADGSTLRLADRLNFEEGEGTAVWLPSGHVLFMRQSKHAGDMYDLDLSTPGKPAGPAHLRGTLPGRYSYLLNVDANGHHVAFMAVTVQDDVWIGDLATGHASATFRRFTLDERMDEFISFTPPGDGVFFASNRLGSWALFRQPLTGGSPAFLVHYPDNLAQAGRGALTADGRSLLLDGTVVNPARPGDLLLQYQRWSLGAKAMETLAEPEPYTNQYMVCSSASGLGCLRGEQTNDEFIVRKLDAGLTTGPVMLRMPNQADRASWALSPDGQTLAVGDMNGGIRMVRLADRSITALTTQQSCHMRRLTWASDGQIYAVCEMSGTTRILSFDPDGTGHVLLERPGGNTSGLAVSPDGRHLGFTLRTIPRDIWLLDNP